MTRDEAVKVLMRTYDADAVLMIEWLDHSMFAVSATQWANAVGDMEVIPSGGK